MVLHSSPASCDFTFFEKKRSLSCVQAGFHPFFPNLNKRGAALEGGTKALSLQRYVN
jgi:hypothetical protein